jgi:zeaxanthin glucosyltransferase
MARIGLCCFIGRGHLYPAASLARTLISRGHHITCFHARMAQATIRAAGMEFSPIDEQESEPIHRSAEPCHSSLISVEAFRGHARRILRNGLGAIRAAGIDLLIIDQNDLASGSIAEFLGIRFITLACSPFLYLNDRVPPACFSWRHSSGFVASLRNKVGNSIVNRVLFPIVNMVNDHRRIWRLPPFRHLNEVFSKDMAITQLPELLEFADPRMPEHYFYAGPLHSLRTPINATFPWDKLNGKPLVYASMGTIHNDRSSIFRIIAESCSAFDVQLVLSLGGGMLSPEQLGALKGSPIVVHYAPQLAVLANACLTITHGGLNTVLESVASGVPLIAIPITDDQPGVSARIVRCGAAVTIPVHKLSVRWLKSAIHHVLSQPSYKHSAQRLQNDLQKTNGAERAATIIEKFLIDMKRVES